MNGMAKIVPGLKVGQLKKATHLELMKDVAKMGESCAGVMAYFPQVFNEFREKVAAEERAMMESRKSQYTPQIQKKDEERDSTLVLAKTLLRTNAMVAEESVREAAEFLASNSRLLKTKVSPQYDEQSGELRLLCDELLGRFAAETERAGILPNVLQLKRLNEEMEELMGLRDEERGRQGRSRVAACRLATDRAFRELIRAVNACEYVFWLGRLSEEPAQDPFKDFIVYLLGVIARYKRQILREKGEKEEEILVKEE